MADYRIIRMSQPTGCYARCGEQTEPGSRLVATRVNAGGEVLFHVRCFRKWLPEHRQAILRRPTRAEYLRGWRRARKAAV